MKNKIWLVIISIIIVLVYVALSVFLIGRAIICQPDEYGSVCNSNYQTQ